MSAPASVSAAALASGIRSAGGLRFRLDPFAFRQFDNAEYSGTRLTGVDKEAFVAAVIDHFAAEPVLVDGYAEFCKHIFMPNFTSATVGAVPITDDNEHLLRSGYLARRPEELPVLDRWFPADAITVPKADILYSSAQIAKEHEAMPSGDPPPPADSYDWGIISIKGQAVNYEIPMNPITMMRNALGTESGGSGVALDPEKYAASVAFWKAHASFR